MKNIIFFIVYLSSFSIYADEVEVKDSIQKQSKSMINLTVKPFKINAKLESSTPIPVKLIRESKWSDELPLGISIFALIFSVFGFWHTRKTYKHTLQKSIHDDHWFRQVIHPHCFMPCLVFIEWASENFSLTSDNEIAINNYLTNYGDNKRKLIKSIRLLYISKESSIESVEEIEKILFELDDRITGQLFNLPEADRGTRYAIGDFFFEDAMNDISMVFKNVHGDIVSI